MPIMSSVPLLREMFRYNAWANAEFFAKLELLDADRHGEERHVAIRQLNHCLVVNKIFRAHLTGRPHSYTADNTPETPGLSELAAAVAASDRWYLDYLEGVSEVELAETIAFTFTDGDRGCMSRQEILTHAAIHGAYHRGEVGRILRQISAALPWDTFAVFLHQAEPGRRDQLKTAEVA
jgi:uncharacterized damage-inducible protein DinB